MPVALSAVPETVESFQDVSNALQKAAHVCTVLGNQRGLVADSYALHTLPPHGTPA